MDTLFEALRKPAGHQDRGCYNCTHNPGDTIERCAYTATGFPLKCIAYYSREDANRNRVPQNMEPYCRELWQAEWEWNGK